METLRPGTTVGFARPSENRKDRDAAIRIECLNLLTKGEQGMTVDQAVAAAQQLFDFVVDKPKRPTLFVIKRVGEVDGMDMDPDHTHVSISGGWVCWSTEHFAYRFRSAEEARLALQKHDVVLFGETSALWQPVEVEQMPDHYEAF